ncbi:MAG: hypothetical protein IT161_15780 [Bryobacterales bacterium]|nr:hypothetical protein [Bryobacterales bacterium]
MSSRIRSGAQAEFRPIRWNTVGDPLPQMAEPDTLPAQPKFDEGAWMQRVEQARAEGLRQGEAAAWDRAKKQTEQAVERMAAAVAELAGFRPRFRHEAEHQIVDLALAVARKILDRELHVDPEVLLGVVKAALAKLSLREVMEIRVNPAHGNLVQAYLGRNVQGVEIRVQPDPSLEPGAVLIETARGAIDASVETQLMEIRRGFADLMERR